MLYPLHIFFNISFESSLVHKFDEISAQKMNKMSTHRWHDEYSFTTGNSHLLGLEEARCSRWREESPRMSRPSLLPTKSLFSLSFLSFSLLSLYKENKTLNWPFNFDNTLIDVLTPFAQGIQLLQRHLQTLQKLNKHLWTLL